VPPSLPAPPDDPPLFLRRRRAQPPRAPWARSSDSDPEEDSGTPEEYDGGANGRDSGDISNGGGDAEAARGGDAVGEEEREKWNMALYPDGSNDAGWYVSKLE